MAIGKELPEVEVTVVVDGVALKEYHDHDLDEDDRTITRYIEAASGKNFEVHIKVDKGCNFIGDCLVFAIEVDGKMADTPIIRARRCARAAYSYGSQGLMTSNTQCRKYTFASLETVSDGHTLKNEASLTKHLGTIRVTAVHKDVRGPTAFTPIEVPTDTGFVSEKALKGQTLSHSIGFAKAVKVKESTRLRAEPVSGQPNPFAIYNFNYRSLNALKSMLIIPRTPTPPPLEERAFDSLSQDELRELQRQFKAVKDQQAAAVKVKRERTDDNPRPRKVSRPTRESTQLELDNDGRVRASSTPTLAEQEIIELD